jgi:hypothetical protein
MTTLHLIVHKLALEQRLKWNNILPEARKQLESVLDRINYVIKKYEEHARQFESHILYSALELCSGYSEVVLYGYTRGTCLRVISDKLYEKGFIVSWDIAGTAYSAGFYQKVISP